MSIEAGLVGEADLTVGEQDTALAQRSGTVPVLSTPRVVALAEEASIAAIAGALGDGETTVGMQVQLDHVAPTAVGHHVVAKATVEKLAGRRVTFTVSVNDERGLIAAGRVTRVVVDVERFLAKSTRK